MTSYQLLLFVHVLAVVIWLGGAFVGMLIGVQIRKAGGSAAAFASFCSAFATLAGPLFGGSAVAVLLTGIGMVAQDGPPEFSDMWISIGFTGWLVSTVLGATIVGKTWTRIGVQLNEAGATLEATHDLARKAVTLTMVDIAIRVAIVYVMIARPS